MDIFDNLKKEDTYSLMCLLLYASSGDPKYSTLNELAYLTDSKSFMNILKYYEGQTITIPTLEESKRALQILLIIYYTNNEGVPFSKAVEMAGVRPEDEKTIAMEIYHFEKRLEKMNYKSGGIKNVFKELKS